jgi:hypothetical protein
VPSVVSECTSLCQMLSVSAPICAKCCQCVQLYVQNTVSACTCMCQVLSVFASVCTKCCQCVHLYVQNVASACTCMCQVLSVFEMYVPSAGNESPSVYGKCPILRKLCSALLSLFLSFLLISYFYRVLTFFNYLQFTAILKCQNVL